MENEKKDKKEFVRWSSDVMHAAKFSSVGVLNSVLNDCPTCLEIETTLQRAPAPPIKDKGHCHHRSFQQQKQKVR